MSISDSEKQTQFHVCPQFFNFSICFCEDECKSNQVSSFFSSLSTIISHSVMSKFWSWFCKNKKKKIPLLWWDSHSVLWCIWCQPLSEVGVCNCGYRMAMCLCMHECTGSAPRVMKSNMQGPYHVKFYLQVWDFYAYQLRTSLLT